MATIYDFKTLSNRGKEVNLADYKGQVILIVNTASKCGFTPQYDGLEELYKKYKDQGFVILGFPCDQFANQEPGSDEQIEEFCRLNHGVTFPLMAKSDVNGANANPVFEFLKSQAPAGIQRTQSKSRTPYAQAYQQECRERKRYPLELHQIPRLQRRSNNPALCAGCRTQRF